MFELISQMEDEVVKCVRCGVCRAYCPVFLVTNAESAVSRGKVCLVEAVIKGELDLTNGFADKLYRCVNCRTVAINCPTGVQVHDIILQARAQLVKYMGLSKLRDIIFRSGEGTTLPLDKRLAFFQEEIIRNLPPDNPWHMLLPLTFQADKFQFSAFGRQGAHSNVNSAMKVGLFIGSAVDMLYPQIAESAVNVLSANGFEVIIPSGQKCSGYTFRTLGDIDTASFLARANVSAFASADVSAIVTLDSACALEMKQGYPKLLGYSDEVRQFSDKVYEISTFLTEKVGLDGMKLVPLKKKVTYHSACTLGKGLRADSASKRILRAVPGIEFVEMRGEDLCCGSGCNVFAMGRNYELSMKIAERKFENIVATGADIIVTNCSYCRWQLDDMMIAKGIKKEFMHPIQVLELATLGD